MALDQVFVEQAEYLEDESFIQWNAEHPDEARIIRKLTQGGAKLISGPRGCGKTTLMLKAFHGMLQSSDAAFPVYVNFKRALRIEPIYKEGTDGTYWFNQWIIFKIYSGVYATLEKISKSVDMSVSREEAHRVTSALEMAKASGISTQAVTIDRLTDDLARVYEKVGRTRAVLLLDDAAHAFSSDQQRDFFDFFRQVKTQTISPKAAVYPGVTAYSSSFHVGHDAEQINAWLRPDNDKYLDFMHELVRSRLPDKIYKSIAATEYLDLMSFASFGVPRALLNMLQELAVEEDDEIAAMNLTRAEVLRAIKQNYANTRKLFSSLSAKVPVYKVFIETGDDILNGSLSLIKQYNRGKPAELQSVSIAIATDELSPEITKIFEFFQYAGLCLPKEDLVSRGVKGRFQLYTMHYAGIIDSNAFFSAKAINVSDYVIAFKQRNAHEFTRTRADALLAGRRPDTAFALSLPPCAVCKTPRPFADAAFCSRCGSPLTTPSTYNSLMNSDIDVLPLTPNRIQKIKAQSSIRKIKDILLDSEHRELLKVDRIGSFWAARIVSLAEEFVE
jgi:KaiC/GvpD/RAD55 family RecA-like ATPase